LAGSPNLARTGEAAAAPPDLQLVHERAGQRPASRESEIPMCTNGQYQNDTHSTASRALNAY
jgi:hypothetical protein